MSDDTFLSGLNDAQRSAVEHPLGKPAMVLAGAGSGKTKVLTTRAAWLMSTHQVRADRILLVTFTNKASQEMVGRVERQTGVGLPYSGTFHRLGARLLRAHGPKIGVSRDFTIYDEDDQVSLMTAIIKELGLSTKEAKPRAILSQISSSKNELIPPEEYTQFAKGRFQELVARLYPIYQRRLRQSDALDFDDLLVETVKLLSEDESTRQFFQEQFEHVLIDEYQDTNTVQYALTKMLTKPQNNLYVVGDFSQAIYGWRGADYRNMMSLKDDYPDIATYRLEQNYRSTQPILDAASGVISNNTSHPVLSLWTEKTEGKLVVVFEAARDTEEVAYVIRKIREFRGDRSLSDMVVLYRTNAQSRVFEERLIAEGIPYKLVGGVRFYERREIKDLLSYLRLLVNEKDEMASKRIEKLGKRKYALFLSWLHEHADEYARREEQPSNIDIPSTRTALTALDAVIESTKYLENFDEHEEEDQARLENIQELRSLAAQFPDVPSLLETVALVEQDALRKETTQGDALTLMSVHAAKGLEYAIVFLVGMEEGLFPHSRSLLDKQQMEEERRLCYVAMTRAKDTLIITYAHRRMTFGTVSGSIISRFILEMPASSYTKEGAPVANQNIYASPSYNNYSSYGYGKKKEEVKDKTPRFVPFDDPSIDDFLEGSMNVSDFLNS